MVIQTTGEAKLKASRCTELPDGWWRLEIESDQPASVLVSPARMADLITELLRKDAALRRCASACVSSRTVGVLG